MEKFIKLKNEMIQEASALPITDWELIISESEDVSASAFKGEINKEASSLSTAMAVRVIASGFEGTAMTEALDVNEIRGLVARAYDNAITGEKSVSAPLFEGEADYPETESFEEMSVTLRDVKEAALRKLSEIKAADSRVSDGSTASAAYGRVVKYYASSRGIELSSHRDNCYVMASAKVSDDEEVKNAYSVKEGNLDGDVTEAVSKAVKSLHAEKAMGGKYDIVFSPDSMQQILETFFSVFSGKSSAYDLTRYKGREGEKVASKCIRIVDDPLYPGYRCQASYDGDGCPVYTKDVITDGVLNTLLYNMEFAARCGKKTTGNGYRSAASGNGGITSYSFYIAPGNESREEVFRKAEGGIYVTEMKGFHAGANDISGDFSIESAGFLIEDGRADKPVKEFTVSGNFYELLENAAAVADDLEFDVTLAESRFGSPSVLVKNLSVSGK